MDARSYFVLQVCCWAIASCFAIGAAWFEVLDRSQRDKQRRRTRAKYRIIWRRIQRSGVTNLPVVVVRWSLRAERALIKRSVDLVDPTDRSRAWWLILFFGGISVPLFGALLGYGWVVGGGLLVVIALPIAGLFHAWGKIRDPEESVYIQALFALLGLASSVAILGWLRVFLPLPTGVATVAMAVFSPVLGVYLAWAFVFSGLTLSKYWHIYDDNLVLMALAAAASFLVTMIALLVGKISAPAAVVPQTVQLMLTNVVCDSVTMVATVLILRRAVSPESKLSLVFAILLDIAIAAILACASLWIGLLFTKNALTIGQVWSVLLAQSPEGTTMEIGPYFWVMHTTFLPTLVYCSMILLCWLGKLVVLPVATLLKGAAAIEKPHHLSAGVFALVAVIFTVAATGIGHLRSTIASPAAQVERQAESGVDGMPQM